MRFLAAATPGRAGRAIAFCLIVSASVIASSAHGQSGLEARAIGKVATVNGAVTVEHTAAVALQAKLTPSLNAKAGDPVYLGDIIQTGPDGRAGILFSDGTAFNIAGNARLTLDQFVYDPNGKSNWLFNLAKGTATFVAGQIAKNGTMKIETPAATMGIRGTTPHIEIADDGTVSFATLIEEGKENAVNKRRSTPVERRAQNRSKGQKNIENSIEIVPKICNGC